jgi:predicted metal-dependent peptidase
MTEPELVKRVLARLLLRHPFLASLALRLVRVDDPSARTAWTDGVHLAVNPAWFAGLADEERLTLLAHECYHVALGHHLRRGSRDLGRWNRACDYAVNTLLAGDGFTLFPGALHDPAYGDACAEAIYNLLPPPEDGKPAPTPAPPMSSGASAPSAAGPATPPPSPPSSGGSDPAAPAPGPEEVGEVRDLPSPAPPTPGEQEDRLAQHAILVTALAQQSRAIGSDSAGARRARTAALEPATVDWRTLLIEFLTARHQQDYSWSRPNRRYAPLGLYLPHLAPAAPDRIAFVVDTSGSVPASVLAAVTAELEEYLLLYPTATLDVLYADAAVAGPALTALAGDEIPPSCVVYLTDLCGAFPEEPPALPVLWLVFGTSLRPRTAPFGRVVPLPF